MKYIVSNGLRLAYRIDGPDEAPTIVLLHSLGTNLRMWDPQVELLSHALRIVRYDYRGHGDSAVPTEPYTIQHLGLDLLALLDALHVDRAYLCGLSLGGLISQWCVANHPDRVSGAVFANTAARIGTREMWDARIDAVKTGGMGAVRDAVLARFLSETYRRVHPEQARRIGEMIETTDPSGYISACAVLRDTDLRDVVRVIHVPALIVAGELDEATPPSQAHELHAAIAGSELIILRGATHLSNIEQPEQFSKCILTLLNRA